jgi:hypothetical protein
MRVVAALGGNALLKRGDERSSDFQLQQVVNAAEALTAMAEQHDLVVYADFETCDAYCETTRRSCGENAPGPAEEHACPVPVCHCAERAIISAARRSLQPHKPNSSVQLCRSDSCPRLGTWKKDPLILS